MYSEQWSRVLAASVAPVVIISASALLCLTFYNRLAMMIARLRAVHRERLEIQERLDTITPGEIGRGSALRHQCILESLSEQSARIVRRAKLIRGTLLCLLGAIMCLVVSSLLNGLTIVWTDATLAAAFMFVVGMVLLFAAVSCAMMEMMVALEPAQLETEVVGELTGDVPSHN